ncbi:succinate dehydrogenase, cytochrome b556 subunit [Noviherbaspirillum sp. UKPF54]|uniref:succinate dehydrogenase, cytochrome b556 subunit n=1 Tax=Noviherbaspirillum sp. UKPF54 TaxID=2601898 RepID=UPI0011B1C405|nr:succinate dehydrogenase, cytochrome b556 subunit [Noviherbaspirillum sp. UKPF54]QDZ28202.1 succinate dehydrogenase, cytochrome b556 subunit [Noviherbaspirillum sp. UKPF54]
MSEAVKKSRRQFNVMSFAQTVHYRLPLAGIVSILHRISGMLIFLLLPFILYLLDKSLTSEISFEYFKGYVSHPLVKLAVLALSWAYLHHFCAGVRHLLMDLHMGLDKNSARKSSVAVFAVSLPLAALVALKLFGAF